MGSSEEKVAKTIRNILAVMLVILTMWVFKTTASFSINFILALFIFLVFLPLCITLDKAGWPHLLTTFLVTVLMILVVVVFGFFIYLSVNNIISTVPSFLKKVDRLDSLIVSIVGKWTKLPEDFTVKSYLQLDQMNDVILSAVKTLSTSAITIVKDGMLTILLSVFLLMERSTVIPKIMEVTKADSQTVTRLFDKIYKQVAKYIYIKLIVSVATGICFFLICQSVGQDFAAVLGVLATLLNFIPTVGSISITLVTIILAFFQFVPNWTPILIVTVGTITTQMIIGNVIDTKLEGSSLNLSMFVIFLSLSVFGYIWGIVGSFLAVPILSVVVIVLANIEETKGLAVLLSSGRTSNKKVKDSDGEITNNKRKSKYDDVVF